MAALIMNYTPHHLHESDFSKSIQEVPIQAFLADLYPIVVQGKELPYMWFQTDPQSTDPGPRGLPPGHGPLSTVDCIHPSAQPYKLGANATAWAFFFWRNPQRDDKLTEAMARLYDKARRGILLQQRCPFPGEWTFKKYSKCLLLVRVLVLINQEPQESCKALDKTKFLFICECKCYKWCGYCIHLILAKYLEEIPGYDIMSLVVKRMKYEKKEVCLHHIECASTTIHSPNQFLAQAANSRLNTRCSNSKEPPNPAVWHQHRNPSCQSRPTAVVDKV